jgi:esterase/lipase
MTVSGMTPRLDTRLLASKAAVSPEAMRAQITAFASLGTEIWDRLGDITTPTLVATGTHDVMIPTS